MTTPETLHIACVGFGEAGGAFVSGWADSRRPVRVTAFDRKTDEAETRPPMRERYAAHGVRGTDKAADAVSGADAIFSVVTADQALQAAEAAAEAIGESCLWLDCNSCAPATKRAAADLIETAGGAYVDVAVMAPVFPKRHEVPVLLSGPHAARAEAMLLTLGMKPRIVGEEVGQASSIKMLRSVMVKGLEALTAECLLAARRAGVEAQVLASLETSDPEIGWRNRASYSLERMIVHGARRAAEMREVAKTVSDLGMPEGMSSAAADWQDWVAGRRATPGDDDLEARLDRILAVE